MLNKVKRQYTIQNFIETKYANRKLKKKGGGDFKSQAPVGTNSWFSINVV